MKNFIKTLLFVGFLGSSAQASTEVITDVVNNTGSSSYATGRVEGVVDLDGRTLIEGNIVTSVVTSALDESVNVSARASSCQTASSGSGTGGMCTLSGISSVEYSIVGDELHYTISTYGGWRPSPYGPGINGVNVTVEMQLSFDDGETGVFDPADQSIHLEFSSTDWADIHYSINGSSLYNYRMTKDGSSFSHQVPFALENGDVIEFFTTSQPTGGAAVDSDWESIEVSSLPESFAGSFLGTSFFASSGAELDFVDVHFKINGSVLHNYSMSGDGFDYSLAVVQSLSAGDEVSYFFTYAIDGIATDTSWETVIVE